MVDRYLVRKLDNLNIKREEPDTNCWVLDYKPTLSNLIIHPEFVDNIKKYIKVNDTNEPQELNIPSHLIIQGDNGVGKWTVIKAIIENYYKIDLDKYNFKWEDDDYEFIKYFNSHKNIIYYVNVSVLTDKENRLLINYINSEMQLRTTKRIFIIRNLDKLPELLQTNLSYSMEKCWNRLLIIGTIKNSNRIVHKMKTLSYIPIIKHMNAEEFHNSYNLLKKQWKLNKLTYKTAYRFYTENNYNLRNTILQIQNSIINHKCKFTDSIEKIEVMNLLNLCIDNTFNSNNEIRQKLYSTITLGVSPANLIKNTLKLIITTSSISNTVKCKSVSLAGQCSHELTKCDRSIFTLEKFYYSLANIINNE